MQPKLCKPSHETHRTSSFKTYLPNLTAFKNSSRRWITDLVFKYLPKNKYAYILYIYTVYIYQYIHNTSKNDIVA